MKGWMFFLGGLAFLIAKRMGYIRFTFRANIMIWLMTIIGFFMMFAGE